MNKNTVQQKFWASKFGNDYTDRNDFDSKTLDQFYKKRYGISRSKINNEFLSKLKINNILEVGCNTGNQLKLLQQQGYKNLYGIEINKYAVAKAKKFTTDINIIQASAFDLPFKDNYFDLVFTAGVLIHINPRDLKAVMKEIYRVSKKYIWGYEYFNENHEQIVYRGLKDRLWKADFAKIYQEIFPDLKLIKNKKYKCLNGNEVDSLFLFAKKQ